MTYEQTTSLIDAMDTLEMYSKLHNNEMNRDDTDWEAVGRYRDNIDHSRKTIFNMANEGTN